ncbi:MAG: ABC transporter permease subunit [Candidatus Lokiarchaeota archaeon]|nr:ABC transporter permease subunit [Candidatus Lokiarchaeota archaeon]
MSLLKYFGKRLLQMIPVVLGAITITFLLSRLTDYNPAVAYMPQSFTSEQLYAMEEALGLHDPLIVQYFIFLGQVFAGDWGNSLQIAEGMPVWDLIWLKFPRTMEITIFAIIFSSIIGIKTGVISAKHRNKVKDTVVRGVALIGVSIPVFWLGILMQFFLSYQLGEISAFSFPTFGYKSAWYLDPPLITGFRTIDSLMSGNLLLFFDYLYHLFLPVLALTMITIAGITRQARSSMLEVLEQDYIRTARAKGCKEKDVINKHALKNALIPTITVIGLNVGGLLGGAVLTETTFDLDGMGVLLITAIRRFDFSVIYACVFVISIVFVVVNLLMDLIYSYLDPRIRY